MIRSLASLFGLHWQPSSRDTATETLRPTRLKEDALGEYLRSSIHAGTTPEVFLRIL